MVLSNAYNYINVLDKAADASWTRNDVLAIISQMQTRRVTKEKMYSLRHICRMRWQEQIH